MKKTFASPSGMGAKKHDVNVSYSGHGTPSPKTMPMSVNPGKMTSTKITCK